MKKILPLVFVLLMGLTVQATEILNRITFVCQVVHGKPISNGHPKSPIQPPTVYLDDYVLTFEADHPDYTLYIKDENGEVVYTTTVYSAQTQVTLPSTLSGDYEIELVMGYWVFTGFISLF